jgi:hypothetical protein
MIDDDCDTLIDCLDVGDCPPGGVACPIAKKDPTDIRFAARPALDRLRSKAVLEGLPENLDLSTVTVGILLTKPGEGLYDFAMPGADLQSNSGKTIFRFRNPSARTDGGMYEIKLKKQRGGTSYSFSTISYADLSGATDPAMRMQFYVGDTVYMTIDKPWKELPFGKGWRAPKDH